MTHSTQFAFDEELRNGVFDLWYPVSKSADVAGKPLGLRRLGLDLIAWRDSSGRIHVQTDTCPHRGAKLSEGEVHGDVLTCAYHGWCFNGQGRCTNIPASRNANESLAPRLSLETYACQERAGLVWVYFPQATGTAPPELVIPEELESPDWSGFICESVWDVNWILVHENLADPMHGPYLHGKSFTLGQGTLEDEIRVVRKDDGFIVERAGQKGINFDWAEFWWDGTLWVRLDIPLPWGPKGILRIVGMVTPIDGDSSLVYFLRYRKLSGLKKTYWHLMYRYFWEKQHAWVIDQDRVILESLRGTALRGDEHLINSDRGVNELRRFLRECVNKRRNARASDQPEPETVERSR